MNASPLADACDHGFRKRIAATAPVVQPLTVNRDKAIELIDRFR